MEGFLTNLTKVIRLVTNCEMSNMQMYRLLFQIHSYNECSESIEMSLLSQITYQFVVVNKSSLNINIILKLDIF